MQSVGQASRSIPMGFFPDKNISLFLLKVIVTQESFQDASLRSSMTTRRSRDAGWSERGFVPRGDSKQVLVYHA